MFSFPGTTSSRSYHLLRWQSKMKKNIIVCSAYIYPRPSPRLRVLSCILSHSLVESWPENGAGQASPFCTIFFPGCSSAFRLAVSLSPLSLCLATLVLSAAALPLPSVSKPSECFRPFRRSALSRKPGRRVVRYIVVLIDGGRWGERCAGGWVGGVEDCPFFLIVIEYLNH